MKFLKLTSALLILAGNISAVQAGGLSSPFSLDSAGVLPKGIRSVRLATFTTELTQKFDGTGAPVGLAYKFNRDVMWKDLINAQAG